jgi:predicted alpha/beta superfamily hydrolase
MKYFQVFALFLICLTAKNSFAQSNSTENKPFVIGEIREINSTILGEKRILNVHLPAQYDSSKSYPVIYLLDGSAQEDFLHIVGLAQFFNMQYTMPEMIIVGIANVDRKRDFTFPTTNADLKKEFPTTGGSEKFIQFIEKELQPFITQNYKTTKDNYLIGQSLGALLASEILLKKPTLFNHYLIVSPSLWWDDESLLKSAENTISKTDYANVYVYIAVGSDEPKIMVKDANSFYKALIKSNSKDFTVNFMRLDKENHATVLHQAINEAFRLLFPLAEK